MGERPSHCKLFRSKPVHGPRSRCRRPQKRQRCSQSFAPSPENHSFFSYPNSMPAPLPGDMRAHTGAHTLGHAFLHVKIRTTQRCGPPPMRHHLSDLIYRPLMVCQEKSAKNSVFFRTKIVKEANGTIKIPLLDYSCRNTTVVCFTYSR